MDYIFEQLVDKKNGYGKYFGIDYPIEVLHMQINKLAFNMYVERKKKEEYRPLKSFYGDKIKIVKFLKDYTKHDVIFVLHYKKFEIIARVESVTLDFFDCLPCYMLEFYPDSLPNEVFYKVKFSSIVVRNCPKKKI